MTTAHDRRWLRRGSRPPAIFAAGLLAAGLLAGSATLLTAAPAAAATTTTGQSFTTEGTYYVTVPQNTTSFSLTGLGGAGISGQASADNSSSGGAGGSGSYITESYASLTDVHPGDRLQIVVGGDGQGATGGSGDGIAGNGGNGGGVTYIYDETGSIYLLVAAGGGGGGGGSGLALGYNGGNGGTDGWGSSGTTAGGVAAGAGGSEGARCVFDPGFFNGIDGGNAPTGSGAGGGGGGGIGTCSGVGGGDGDVFNEYLGAVTGGGGGGGSGYSLIDPDSASSSLTSGTNTGAGSASVTFTVTLPDVAPAVTSANCVYVPANAAGTIPGGSVTATGFPAPDLSLYSAPDWLSLGSQTSSTVTTGLDQTSAPLVSSVAPGTPGEYTAVLQTANTAGTFLNPLKLAVENGTSPAFVSPATATATVGAPFSFQAAAVSCPPADGYSISGTDSSTSGWLSLNTETGVLSGTPSAADAGTHTFTLTANLEGNGGSVTQTFTLQVNPVAPGATVIGTATAGNGQATVAFTPPASDGGSPITGYTVTATDQTTPANGGQTATGTGSPITVTGLTNGDSYTFTVTASNAAGTGPASPATPAGTVTPLPPGKPSADLSVTISPQSPAADGSAFTETVTVTNHGPWPATDVTTGMTVPAQLTVTADPGGSKTGPVVSWQAARIGVNGSVTYTVTLKVSPRARGVVLIASATASHKVPDPRPLNNAAITTVKLG